MQIRTSNFNDCLSVAELHAKYLDKSFLGTLGSAFLTLLYRCLAHFQKGILLVAEYDGKVVGFVAGTINTGKFYKYFLKQNFFRIGFTLLPKIFDTKIIKKLWETATYSKKDLSVSVPDAELLSMAVEEEFQGKGISKELFKKLVIEFHKKGINEFKTIAGNKLVKANKFYQKIGCEKIGEVEVHEGDISTVYMFRVRENETLI